MQNENFLEQISSNISQSAAIKNVFGEPIQSGQKTIIPVASIAYGFGGGFGQGYNKGKLGRPQAGGSTEQVPGAEGSGGGAGGGLRASAKGVYEVTPTSTRFIPASPSRYVLAGMVAGFVLNFFLSHKK